LRWFPRFLFGAAALLSFGLACNVSLADRPRAHPLRSSGNWVISIGGIEYLNTAEFARRYGLHAAWAEAEKKMILSRPGTRLEFEADSREATLNGLRIFMGDAPKVVRGALYIGRVDAERFVGPMINPLTGGYTPRPPVRVIALDAGHGGRDKGKINERLHVNEKTFTLDVVLRLRKILQSAGYKVVLTRSDDRYVELDDRPEIAERAHADVFVSVHFNSVESGASRVTGVEVFSLTPPGQFSTDDSQHEASESARVFSPGNSTDNWNARLAYEAQRQLLADLRSPDRGHKRQRFKVLRLARCPAMLIEAGYLSNDSEARRISTPAYRQELAQSIAKALENYAEVVATRD
jgi:N-acetylmuramoyl-L-alanine amidase